MEWPNVTIGAYRNPLENAYTRDPGNGYTAIINVKSHDPGDLARLREDPQLYQSSNSRDTLLAQSRKAGGSEAHAQRQLLL